jgi:uncharacterized membrane protein YcfT
MSVAPAIAAAVTFVWLGMVMAVSFLEAQLKFRAPCVTLQVGLGIGRLVFRALNANEMIMAAMLAALVATSTSAWSSLRYSPLSRCSQLSWLSSGRG